MADPVIEHSTYTWDPVTASWVHEKGPEISPPPRPVDVHALQSYFFDRDSNEWIRTVLAPMGRELAAKWQGAHRIPQGSAAVAAKPPARRAGPQAKQGPSPILLVIAVVIVAMVGGAGLVGAQNGLFSSVPTTLDEIASFVPQARASAVVDPAAATAAPNPSVPSATANTSEPAPAATRAPAAPAIAIPPGPNVRLPEGTLVVYTGPTGVTRGAFLPASFTVFAPNGRPASGDLTIVLGDLAKDPRIVSGPLDASGRIAVDLPATLNPGAYPLGIVYKGSRAQIATVTIR